MAKEYKAFLKSAQISARKSRLVVDMVRGDQVQDALEKLKFMNKKAAPLVVKLIKSAMASATQSATVDVDDLYVAEATVDEGPTAKRSLPRAQGRATPIRKRSSHIRIKLAENL